MNGVLKSTTIAGPAHAAHDERGTGDGLAADLTMTDREIAAVANISGPNAAIRGTDGRSAAGDSAMSSVSVIRDVSDILFFMALALLPVDGTVLGIPLPYWTPLSPWFFLAYALTNWRVLRFTMRAYLPFFLFPLLLILTSVYGWQTIGVHPVAAVKSILSVLLGLACLASLDIALVRKRLPWRPAVTVLVATYWFAFAVGVVQFVAIQMHQSSVMTYFGRMMYRTYIWQLRPQFLFAEPSYIGMHLYGVLLPVYWMTRDCRLAMLIPTFAIGAIAMGSGTRIVIDSVVALFFFMLATVNFRSKRATWGFVGGMSVVGGGTVIAMFADPRLNALLTKGLLAGDASMSSRIFHMLAPMWSWKHDLQHLLFGWGAGNVSDAVRTGYAGARRWYDARGGVGNSEIDGLANPPADTFTMSAYTSFITEFGVLCLALFALAILIHIVRRRGWDRRTVCWLLLVVYLYIQFEAYAFYAWPLLLWGGLTASRRQPDTD
ncbi:hypothetical protein DSM100688_1819 [Bifidobacterium ramosum]|uniref:Uncharacterized protein n=2 Tax=Bifidobacterium ramosum TaxID=1798158 RepID=A0A6L4WYQ8_9BIFI|nr:hypothetical protein [Bifidobacterium ramosum]KAB8287244.1 hypothetical protein DSM100688_1819 [Bifidobacterium ramosum]